MGDELRCAPEMFFHLLQTGDETEPRAFLAENHFDLLQERIIVDPSGREINGRLNQLIFRSQEDARENQREGEPFNTAVIRNALRRLNYNYCQATLAGLPTGPAYERAMPDAVTPAEFGHENVNYGMSDYERLSSLPVGGLGAPICEGDYATCFLREGLMVQDAPLRQINISIQGDHIPTITTDLANEYGTYYALYPFAERAYESLPIPVSILQYSPVIPGNYRSSSLPVEIIELVAENTTNAPLTVTFSITQENFIGWYPINGENDPENPHNRLIWERDYDNNHSEYFDNGETVGLLFLRDGNQTENVRAGTGFAGSLALLSESANNITIEAEEALNLLTVRITLLPGQRISHPVAFAADLPFYHFQSNAADPNSPGARIAKEYTRYYDNTGDNALAIAQDALVASADWRRQITAFQETIIEDPDLPTFFSQALLNELYLLAETGIWDAAEGRFAYLESIDYKMYNTSDVNFYTWALLTLYPELERRDILDLASQVPSSDSTMIWFETDRKYEHPDEWQHAYWAPAKETGTVCHDLGGLTRTNRFPFTSSRCNAYDFSNTNIWIDLAPKFVLRAWRYLSFMLEQTGSLDFEFLETIYPSVLMALDTLEERWTEPTTHLPLSKGTPDWTYDTISDNGYSPNVITLWLAALQAAQTMAEILDDSSTAQRYSSWQEAGAPVLDRLWNENGYYNAFISPDLLQTNDVVHADILLGDFFARMTGLNPIAPDDLVTQSLNSIYRINGEGWSRVGNHGPLGLVNVRCPDGEPHGTEQGNEGWTGVMLLNAAYQIRVGRDTNNQTLIDNGWRIIQGFYNVVHSESPDGQHWFGRTPEGYTNPDDPRFNEPEQTYGNESGRAPRYMRALAIWAIYAVIRNNQMPFDFYNLSAPETPYTTNLPYGGQR